MTLKEFRLPDIGEGIAEGEIVSWRVKVGQQVHEEDEFVEVMTDKATVMITVPWDGVITELRFKDGDVVPVQSVMAVIDTSGARAPVAATTESPVAVAPETPVAATATGTALLSASPGKVLAAPATRRRAREMGIDLQQVRGTGPRGRITLQDLTSQLGRPQREEQTPAPARPALTRPATPPVRPATPPGQREQRVPIRGLRRKIAEAMTRSKSTAAHFTYVDDIDVTDLVKIRRNAKAAFAEQGINITYMPFIMKAVVEAMKAYPTMNSSLDEGAQELVIKHYYNIGFATDTDDGLVVPVVVDVDQKSISELAREIQELAQSTRDGKFTIDDLTGGTFTITNAGNIGGLFATPIINYPEAAILGVHAIKKTPVVRDGEIVVGDVMYLSVSIDHRIVDGATGARWMNVVKQYLENPSLLLLGSM